MSNQIVLTSKFNPFSYQELLAPVQMADTEHKGIEEEQGKLETLSDQWKNKLNPEIDKKAYAQYTGYLNSLQQQAADLAKNGLTPGARKSLLDAKANYASQIVPIEQAFATRQLRADEQRKLAQSDPTYMHERDLGTASVDEFMTNPNLSSRGISGSYFTKAVADAGEQISKEMRTDVGREKWHTILGGQAFQKLTQYGFNSKEVLAAINDNPNAAPELTKLIKTTIDSSGIKDWNNPQALQKAYQFAKQGLYHAIGTSQEKEMNNKNYMDPLQRAQLGAMNPPAQPNSLDKTYAFNELNPKKAKEYDDMLNKLFLKGGQGDALAKYFGKDGRSNPLKQYKDWYEKNKGLEDARQAVVDRYTKLMNSAPKEDYKNNSSTRADFKYSPEKHPELYKDILKGKTWAQVNAPRTTNDRPNINDSEYKFLQSLGITDKDGYDTVKNKLLRERNMAQSMVSGYSMGLNNKGLNKVYDEILKANSINGNKALVKLDEDNNPTNTYATLDDLRKGYDNKIHNSIISEVLYIPGVGHVVINQKGERFKINSLNDQFNNGASEYEITHSVQEKDGSTRIQRGINDYMAIYRNPNASLADRMAASEKIKESVRGILAKSRALFSGNEDTPNAPETSSKGYDPFLLTPSK